MKYFLIILLNLSAIWSAEGACPAGIALYYKTAEDSYLLLVDDADQSRGWSSFGGGVEEGETFQQTAARETEEETRGYFHRDWLIKQLADQKPDVCNGFSMFFVEVPFVPAVRVQQNPLDEKAGVTSRERVHFALIPLIDVERALKTGKSEVFPLCSPSVSKNDSYWSIWLGNMNHAYEVKACPWLKEE